MKHGWRSGLEEAVATQLDDLGVSYKYEKMTLPYVPPQKVKKYTPDFVLDNGIVIETKGRWVTADRQKIKTIKEQYPGLDLRIVFSNSKNRISKISKTTYGMYCEKLGIPYADKLVPVEWTKEKTKSESLEIIDGIMKGE